MKLLGNYLDWVKPEWIQEVLENDGPQIPKDYRWHEEIVQKEFKGEFDEASWEEERKDWAQMNYLYKDRVYFEMFDRPDLSFDLWKDRPPFLDFEGPFAWWLTKLNPGMFTPMHRDSYTTEKQTHKYWMPWTDWEPGHVLMTEDECIIKWQAGDVYYFEDPFILHGAGNAGQLPRIALQIVNYRPNRGIL